jgi:hypothetical protein
VCQVIAGNVLAACHLIAVSVLPPNRRLQLTPLGGERDRADFESWNRLDTFLGL